MLNTYTFKNKIETYIVNFPTISLFCFSLNISHRKHGTWTNEKKSFSSGELMVGLLYQEVKENSGSRVKLLARWPLCPL